MSVASRATIVLLAISVTGCCCSPSCSPPCCQGCGYRCCAPYPISCCQQVYQPTVCIPQPVYYQQQSGPSYRQVASHVNEPSIAAAGSGESKRVDRNASYRQVPDPRGRTQGTASQSTDLEESIVKLQDCSAQYCREIKQLKCRVDRLEFARFTCF
jgi:hypothetical protein